MVKFILNGKEVEALEGSTILQVAEANNINIPTLCNNKALEPAGLCRLCAVRVSQGSWSKLVTACNYPIWEGMEVVTHSEEIVKHRKMIVEFLLARCPENDFLKQLAAEYGIESVRLKAGDDNCILCGLCVRVCERMGPKAIDFSGRGTHMEVTTPFRAKSEECVACGACASICPTGRIDISEITDKPIQPIPSEYDEGLRGRKPIYIPYAQAIPNTPAIDRSKCAHFINDGCKICAEFCPVGAIDHSQVDEEVEIEVGAIVVATGYEPFNPSKFDTYAYSNLPNVVTSMEFERFLSASGPTLGHLVRPSDHREPHKIAWLQCVGSRDIQHCDHKYCSAVCCMYAIKEAVIAKEHAGAGLDAAVFYMDMRTHGKDFEKYYNRAKDQHGVRFVRSRVHTVNPVPGTDDLELNYVTEDGVVKTERFDMVVLSVGFQSSESAKALAGRLDLKLNDNSFCLTNSFAPVETSKPGIFVSGAFQSPKDIPQSVVEASAAASAAASFLSSARGTMTREKLAPPQVNVVGERPRIGVFVCHCGINIAGVVDVEAVREYAKTLPFVEYVTNNLYTCSQDTQVAMRDLIKEKNLNRIVVAACTPRTHEALFQETMADAGLNKYLFEMANIRNHDSWVHNSTPEMATEKAKDLVRMAVSKVALLEPLQEPELSVNQKALVIGGGVAGMTAARAIADQGYPVRLIESSDKLGGQALNLYKTWRGEEIGPFVSKLADSVMGHPNISVRLSTKIVNVDGFVGNFRTTVQNGAEAEVIEHGVAVIATGGRELKPTQYGYGADPRIVTHLELDRRFIAGDKELKKINSAVFIQCVGSREAERPYCSRVCCTHSLESALQLKKLNPEMDIYVLYRDLRSYGERETLYLEARKSGVIFIRFDSNDKPVVEQGPNGKLHVTVTDHVLRVPITLTPDLVTLSMAIEPNESEQLGQFFKVPANEEGFFIEAHAKLRPVDFATDGVFLCGIAHYPKPIDESIAQAQAAASRAATILAKQTIHFAGTVAYTNQLDCSACATCVSICPYSAPGWNEKSGKAEINPALCKGCGLCVASCRSGAIRLRGFDDAQIFSMIESI